MYTRPELPNNTNPSRPPITANEMSIKNRLLVSVMGAILPQPAAPVIQTMTAAGAKFYNALKSAPIEANPGSGYDVHVGRSDRRRKLRPFMIHKEKV